MVIIFSDMFENEDPEKLFSALQHLRHNKHEVILFHVMDKYHELDFAFDNRPYKFVDIESGEEVKVQSDLIKKAYKEQIKNLQENVRQKCLQYRIDYQLVDINKDLGNVLQSFLVKRTKMST